MDIMIPAGFDKEKFQRKEATVFLHFTNELNNGNLYSIAERTEQPFFYVEWAKFLCVFKFKPEEFIIKKKLFKNEAILNWNHLKKLAKKALEMNNQEIQNSDVMITVISLYDIYNGWTDLEFHDSLREQFEEAKFERLLAKKFKLDQSSHYIQLRQMLKEANRNDPLYNEFQFEVKRTEKIYNKVKEEYSTELVEFHDRMRQNKQLDFISQYSQAIS